MTNGAEVMPQKINTEKKRKRMILCLKKRSDGILGLVIFAAKIVSVVTGLISQFARALFPNSSVRKLAFLVLLRGRIVM